MTAGEARHPDSGEADGGASRPEDVSPLLHFLLRNGELDEAARLYEEEAAFIEVDGIAHGRTAIREAHRRFSEAGLHVQLVDQVTFVVDDLALVQWSWIVETENGDSRGGVSAEVLRRQTDGSWKFVIDNSDGAAMLDHS